MSQQPHFPGQRNNSPEDGFTGISPTALKRETATSVHLHIGNLPGSPPPEYRSDRVRELFAEGRIFEGCELAAQARELSVEILPDLIEAVHCCSLFDGMFPSQFGLPSSQVVRSAKEDNQQLQDNQRDYLESGLTKESLASQPALAISELMRRFAAEHPQESRRALSILLEGESGSLEKFIGCVCASQIGKAAAAFASQVFEIFMSDERELACVAAFALPFVVEDSGLAADFLVSRLRQVDEGEKVLIATIAQSMFELGERKPLVALRASISLLSDSRPHVQSIGADLFAAYAGAEGAAEIRERAIPFLRHLLEWRDVDAQAVIDGLGCCRVFELLPQLADMRIDGMALLAQLEVMTVAEAFPILDNMAEEGDTEGIALFFECLERFSSSPARTARYLFERLSDLEQSFYRQLRENEESEGSDEQVHEQPHRMHEAIPTSPNSCELISEFLELAAQLNPSAVTPVIEQYLDRGSEFVRFAAIRAYGEVPLDGKAKVDARLVRIIGESDDPSDLHAALNTLAERGGHGFLFLSKLIGASPRFVATQLWVPYINTISEVASANPEAARRLLEHYFYREEVQQNPVAFVAAQLLAIDDFGSGEGCITSEAAVAKLLSIYRDARYPDELRTASLQALVAAPAFGAWIANEVVEELARDDSLRNSAEALLFALGARAAVARHSMRRHLSESNLDFSLPEGLDDQWSAEVQDFENRCHVLASIGRDRPHEFIAVLQDAEQGAGAVASSVLALADLVPGNGALRDHVAACEAVVLRALNHELPFVRHCGLRLVGALADKGSVFIPQVNAMARWERVAALRELAHEVLGLVGEPRTEVLETLTFGWSEIIRIETSLSDAGEYVMKLRALSGVCRGLMALSEKEPWVVEEFCQWVKRGSYDLRRLLANSLDCAPNFSSVSALFYALFDAGESPVREELIHQARNFGAGAKEFLELIQGVEEHPRVRDAFQ